MKNYIANERGHWATSSGYVKYSLGRSIHFGRLYTRTKDEKDLCEALRCLGQGLHTLEDFAAHTNYCELALREMGFLNVFPHTGTDTQINLHGHYVFPVVTGTFGMVDFLHSMLGEATDHFTQSEVSEMDIALGNAQGDSSGGALGNFLGNLKSIPGTGDLASEAKRLQDDSDAQGRANTNAGYPSYTSSSRSSSRAEPGAQSESGSSGLPDIDPQEIISRIYPILAFRDKVVRRLTDIIEKFPAVEALVEKISETVTVFVMSLLAPFVRPLIKFGTETMKTGSSGVIQVSAEHQFEPWTDPSCTDPTHSLLSKDHFANVLNEPAGQVASEILKYAASRVLYAWEHTHFPEHRVLEDCLQVFHHPALRDMRNEAHRNMFEAVESWVNAKPGRADGVETILSAEGVRTGKNNGGRVGHSHGGGGGGFSGGESGHSSMGQLGGPDDPQRGVRSHLHASQPSTQPYTGTSSDYYQSPAPQYGTAASYYPDTSQYAPQYGTAASYYPDTSQYGGYGSYYQPSPAPPHVPYSEHSPSGDYYQGHPPEAYVGLSGYGQGHALYDAPISGHAQGYGQSHPHYHGQGHVHDSSHPHYHDQGHSRDPSYPHHHHHSQAHSHGAHHGSGHPHHHSRHHSHSRHHHDHGYGHTHRSMPGGYEYY